MTNSLAPASRCRALWGGVAAVRVYQQGFYRIYEPLYCGERAVNRAPVPSCIRQKKGRIDVRSAQGATGAIGSCRWRPSTHY